MRFSRNSEANASEFIEHLISSVLHTHSAVMSVAITNLQLHTNVLPVAIGLD